MNYDLDVHLSAAALIEELGEGAPVFAANQAQALLGFGDMNGYQRWNQIQMASYEQLWSPEPDTRPRPTAGR